MTGPGYILVWCTAHEGLKTAYYTDSPEGREALKGSLANLSSAFVYFIRIYQENTIAIVDMLAPKPA